MHVSLQKMFSLEFARPPPGLSTKDDVVLSTSSSNTKINRRKSTKDTSSNPSSRFANRYSVGDFSHLVAATPKGFHIHSYSDGGSGELIFNLHTV